MSDGLLERKVGAKAYITIIMNRYLAAGEQIASVVWTSSDAALATLVAASEAISSDGRSASAEFDHLAEGVVRITATVTTTNPVEIEPVWIVVQQIAAPTV
jgi:hypothetical protein